MYYDILDFPLTENEIHRWLYWPQDAKKVDFSDVVETLDSSATLKDFLACENGFWYLKNKGDGALQKRISRAHHAQKKYRKLKHLMFFARMAPFVKAVFATNTLSYNNTRKESDIDLFVITQESKLWSARFFFVGMLKFLGMRPGQLGTNENKMCLNFFLSERSLNISDVALKNRRGQIVDVHLASLVAMMVPIYDPQNIFPEFLVNNEWVRDFFYNFYGYEPQYDRKTHPTWWTHAFKNIFERIFGFSFLEKKTRDFQLKIMPQNLKLAALEPQSNVVINDNMLKFHLLDRRKEYLQEFHRRYREFVTSMEQEEKHEYQKHALDQQLHAREESRI